MTLSTLNWNDFLLMHKYNLSCLVLPFGCVWILFVEGYMEGQERNLASHIPPCAPVLFLSQHSRECKTKTLEF